MKRTLFFIIALAMIFVGGSYALEAKEIAKGYELHNQHCLSCHDSIADPEKPGFTQDTWFLIINIMHDKYGMKTIPNADKGMLVDYLYTIRKGIEREAG